jgi:hypothetical protein
MTKKARFLLHFDHTANEVNRRPNLRGKYRLADGNAPKNELSLWGSTGQNGRLYARGRASPEGAGDAIRVHARQEQVEARVRSILRLARWFCSWLARHPMPVQSLQLSKDVETVSVFVSIPVATVCFKPLMG